MIMITPDTEGSRARYKKTPPDHDREERHAAPSASTKTAVLDAAMIVLAREGHANFTVRRVAEEAGISSGHMMYHYPTKQLLLQALISARLQRDEEDIVKVVRDLSSPAARADALMRYLIHIGSEDVTNRLFRQFHAIAVQDTVVSRLLSEYYERTIIVATDAIWQSDSSLSKDQVAAAVQLMAAVSEGAGLLHGLPLNRAFDTELIADQASHALRSLLETPR
jgi:AcrR family transcriptional regulator